MKNIKYIAFTVAALLFLPLLGGAGAVAYMQYGPCAAPGNLCVVGDVRLYNNGVFSDWNTATGEEASVVLDGSAGGILLGVGNTTAATWNLVYSSADTATLLDSDALAFGTGGAESEIASDGTDTTWTVISGDLVLGTDGFVTQIEGAMALGAVSTFVDSDTDPDVSGNTYWITNTTTVTITDFDGSGIAAGQIIFIDTAGTITYDVTSSGLVCGGTDVITSAGDWIGWIYDGTDWNCFFFMDLGDNQNTWGAA